MQTAELTTTRVNEDETVLSWRLEQLRAAGYPRRAAQELAGRRDVDLHLAVELVRRGCTPVTALRILL
jgi:hypothetical protein